MGEVNRLQKILEHSKISKEVVREINGILSSYNCSLISEDELNITEKIVTDGVKRNSPLSSTIINYYWPSITKKTVYHYTTAENAESILNSGTLRLYNIQKRYSEGEIGEFCKIHSLDGFLSKDEQGREKYKTLIMPNTFYSSFTHTNLTSRQESYFRSQFGDVRFKIDLEAENPDFRKIVYSDAKDRPLELLAKISKLVSNRFHREFILAGISRICAFFLSHDYDIESELRILYREWNFRQNVLNDGKFDYVELPFGDEGKMGYKVNVMEVQTDEPLNAPPSYNLVARR